MIKPIVIKVTDKVPELVSGPDYVVCDNSDYTVVWQLDEEWAQFEHRTMQVNYKDGTYERVLFTGDTCALPALPVPGPVHVGLFAGDIHTTRPARLLAVRSGTTSSGEERDPMPNGYAQAIQALDAKLDKNQGAENAGKALVVGDDGNVVPGEAQGGSYTLPVASPEQLGGVKPTAKTDEMTQQVGVDEDGALYTKPGKASDPVQSDWQQNDETAADYVKNRPGAYDKYDVNITWDGVVGDRVTVVGARGVKIVHVSDEILTVDQINGSTLRTSNGREIIIGGITDADSVFMEGIAVFVSTPGWTFKGVTFPKAGVYFASVGSEWYVASMTKGTAVKIPHKYLELPKEVMVVNFTQDDDGNWSADKNWEEVYAAIEAGGPAYATTPYDIICPLGVSTPGQLVFRAIWLNETHSVTQVSECRFIWEKEGGILLLLDDTAYVGYDDDQSLATDQQAQARANIGLTPVAKTDAMTQSVGLDAETGELWTVPPTGDSIVLASSTAGSTKKFRIVVDDSGTLSAVEVTDAS